MKSIKEKLSAAARRADEVAAAVSRSIDEKVDEAVVKAQALKHVAGTWAVEENKVKSYRLSYFNSRGLAEVTRYLFVLKDIPFEDKRYSVYEDIRSDSKAWVSPDFETDKAAGRFPFGRLPLLEVEMDDGHVVGIAQSRSIERYVARKLGLLGATDEEMAIVDMVCDQVDEIAMESKKQRSCDAPRSPTLKPSADTSFDRTLLAYCEQLNQVYEFSGAAPYLLGHSPSLADIVVYCWLRTINNGHLVGSMLGIAPKLSEVLDRLGSNERIVAYEEKRVHLESVDWAAGDGRSHRLSLGAGAHISISDPEEGKYGTFSPVRQRSAGDTSSPAAECESDDMI